MEKKLSSSADGDGESSVLNQLAQLGGLKGKDLQTFLQVYNDHTGSGNDFWQQVRTHPDLQHNKNIDQLQAVFSLSKFTGNNLPLMEELVQSGKIKSKADLQTLAAYNSSDWESMLKNKKSKTATAKSKAAITDQAENTQQTAALLEAAFTNAFPTTAFAARLSKDAHNKLPHRDKLITFFQENGQFDLLNHHVNVFLRDNKKALPEQDAQEVASHLQRIQRIFKLSPTYSTTNTLLNGNIHSAHQIYKMGKDNFVNTYASELGKQEATTIFEKASQAHANAVALAGNLRAMADASAMNAFPKFNQALVQSLTTVLPNLETLFGHTDFFNTTESQSVYGAPAYLTDILHFLENRNSTLAVSNKPNRTKASVKDLLLQRRPDIGDIDLNGSNTDTAIPYIDIACEIMEDYIAAPVAIIAASLLPKLVKGTIDAAVVTAINTQLTTVGLTNINTLLTANATISDKYTSGRLNTENTYITEDHWVIRDNMIAFRVTNLGAGGIECRVLHPTLLPAEAISTGSEYVNLNTYNTFLKTAKRPFTLPFDLFETEGDMYLEKLGVTKANLIKTFGADFKTLNGTTDTEKAIAYASLGINQAERTLITVADTANQTLYWGPDVTSSTTSLQVNIFEKLTGLNYQQVMDLISIVAPTVTVVHDDSISADGKQHIFLADTSKQRITNLTATLLDTIHRFLRLWRKTSFTFKELNAIRQSAIGGGNIDAHLVWGLQYFISLQQSLQVSAFELLAFYNTLDKDLYNQLFQNSAITNPVDPVFSTDKVYTDAGNGAFTTGSKTVIAAVLQISMSDLELLFAYIPNLNAITSGAIANLYRHARLARSLGLPVTDLIKLLNLFSGSPFTNLITTFQFLEQYNVLKSSGFSIDELNYILRHQDNSAKTLVPASDVAATALTGLQDALLAVRAATQPVTDPNGDLLNKWLSDPVLNWNTDLLHRLLDICGTANDTEYNQKLQDNANFLINLRILNSNPVLKADLPSLPAPSGVSIVFPASMLPQLSFDPDKKQLVLAGYMSSADRTALLALSSDAAYQNAINALFNAAQQTDSSAGNRFFTTTTDITNGIGAITFANGIQNRFAYFINKIAPVYAKVLQQNGVVNAISTWFNTNKTVVSQLLISVPAIYTDFTTDAFVNKIPATGNTPYPVQTNRYQLLAKTCLIAGRLQLTAADLAFLLLHAADISSLDFNALPVSPVAGGVTTYNSFATLIHLLKFQQYYPARVTNSSNNTTFGIYQVLNNLLAPGATLDTLGADLALLTGWNTTAMGQLMSSPNYLGLSFPADYKSVRVLHRLHNCFTLLKQLGIAVVDAVNWSAPSLAYADSQKIKQTLKSKYSNSDWAAVTTPLQNTLREKKRDALIAYLLANPGTQSWVTDNDLYSYFLLDVEMCSCQPTSRIVQATNSVQLFVQRCFLNLEQSVAVITKVDSNWLQWPWMKNFRVWQANMKVFLYPENYIEPELLPDDIKSSFLKELENDLLQNEATATSVEDAFHNYLEKLDAVARLEVKGMSYDWPSKTLHVFARTYGGNPRVYYHRRFINNKRWTPWKKVDLDISSDHIIPAVYNNRLYLFWATFSEDATLPDGGIAVPSVGQSDFKPTKPVKSWIIQMAFSEYKNGKWTPKKISEKDGTGKIVVKETGDPKGEFPNKENFFFTALDIPAFEYDKIMVNSQKMTQDVFNQKALTAVQTNGKLVVSCYYYKFDDTNNVAINTYVGSFQLDPVKGYPTTLTVKYPLVLQQSRYHLERSNRKSLMVNMLDVETFSGATVSPPENGIPGSGTADKPKILVAEQAGGSFSNLIPLQLDVNDRFDFLKNIYDKTSDAVIKLTLGNTLPYFYQDQRRTYYIVPEWTDNGLFEFTYSDTYDLTITRMRDGSDAYNAIRIIIDDKLGLPHPGGTPTVPAFTSHYYNFHHPLVDYFIQQLFANGIDGLMDRTSQLKGDVVYDPGNFDFKAYFQSVISGFDAIYSGAKLPDVINNTNPDKTPGYPKDDVDFNLQSGYGIYNWELFFHAPLMIAERLSQNQQFDEAERWYKYIFNPMDTSTFNAPVKYWNTKPFFLTSSTDYINERIDSILNGVNSSTSSGDPLIKNVDDWRNNPFQPHFIAQYRTVAYQKVAVMKYVSHLIRHGDYLFSQHTMESINEATQLYILASQILGPKPEVIPFVGKTAVDNYLQLETKLDALSDTLVDIENLLPQHSVTGYTGVTPGANLPPLRTLYFNIPMNEKLAGPTGYWDVVADRLFKIRHCLDIDGNLAQVSLFSAPIDPAMLVRATAAGLTIGSILNDVNAPLPLYRFMTMMQKATELCNDVKSLGGLLLSVLEKKDTEALSLLRSSHEMKLLNEVLEIKKNQAKEVQSTIDNLNKQKDLITIRQQYYAGLIAEGWVLEEQLAMTLNGTSLLAEAGIALGYGLAGGLNLIPQFVIGASGLGSPVATASEGGQQLAAAADHATKMLSSIIAATDKAASILLTKAGYDRRADEWNFQKILTDKELEQIDVQLKGAGLRLEMANKDVDNQQLQIDQAAETDDFMHSKFTNEELFNWMSTQVSNTYFKSYQLAYETAKKAERCFRYELGLSDSAYINFGYWDSLKKGLLAGEQLAYDIHKLELAYIDQNKRELELTKHISLSQLDPVALLNLKTNKECWINLPEELFDMDYPGQYMRRIKSVSLTIPCISGPYTTVSCKLTMTKNSVRTSGVSTSDSSQYPRKLSGGMPGDDPRFRDAVGALQSIATSHGQNDSGLFELNFRDERYLPFEGAGAISLWHLQLPAAIHQFDYNTISDVIIHLKYTARDGGEALKTNAEANINSKISQMLVSLQDKGLMRIFSAKNDLSTEWYHFLHPATPGSDQVLTLNLDTSRFPLFTQGKTIKIKSMELVADTTGTAINSLHCAPAGATEPFNLTPTGAYANWANATIDYGSNKKDPGTWTITYPAGTTRLTDSNPQTGEILVKNMVIIVHYEIS